MKRRLTAAALALALVIAGSGFQVKALSPEQNEEQKLTPEDVLALALADDNEYMELGNELAVQKKDLQQAVAAAGGSDDEEYLWSAFARVTLSEGESLAEYYSAATLPVLLQAGIRVTEAEICSREYELESEITGLYIQISAYQERISVREELLKEKEASFTRIKALVKSGQADSKDADALSKEIEELSESIREDENALEAAIEKLSEYAGEEIEEDALLTETDAEEADWEGALEELTDWAMNNDQAYLSARRDSLEALLDLWTEYTVLNEEYAVPDGIFDYIIAAAAGEAIDTDVFYEEYTAYWEERTAALEQMASTQASAQTEDDISAEDISNTEETEAAEKTGDEEDIYALYDAVLEYQNTVLELETQTLALTESVEEVYNDLLSLRDTCTELQDQLKELQSNMKLYRVRYRMGELSKEDYESLTEELGTLQLAILDAESEYLQAYVSMNSVTNGGLSALVSGELGISEDDGTTREDDTTAAAKIVLSVRAYPGEQMFALSVSVPEEYADEIASFELWNGEVRVGSRTGIDEVLSAVSLSSAAELEIRFYDEAGGLLGTFEVDPSVPVTVLSVNTGYEMK